ncbi:MAG: hypothetical protein RPU51_12075 [Candidatus Sedimenticola sp. (ex Thyasira tokunagai)]
MKPLIIITLLLVGTIPAIFADSFDETDRYMQKGIALAKEGKCPQAIPLFDQAVSLARKATGSPRGDLILAYIHYVRGRCYQADNSDVSAADDYLRAFYFTPEEGLQGKLEESAENLIDDVMKAVALLPRKMVEERRDIFLEKMNKISEMGKRPSAIDRENSTKAGLREESRAATGYRYEDKKEGILAPIPQNQQWDF